MTGRAVLISVLALLPLLALTSCTSAGTSGSPAPTVIPVSGAPLTSSATPSIADGLIGWPGAAADQVHCSGPTISTTRAAPYDGEDTGTTPEAALEAARAWRSWSGAQSGFSFAGEEDARRLYLLEVDSVPKQALILRRGPALAGDGTQNTVTRWWLESWARCDYAELPESVARERGLQLWSNADGQRQLTSTIVSLEFSGDCFPGMTALDVDGPPSDGPGKDARVPDEYVREPAAELRSSYFTDAYIEHATVPADAIDSGYQRDGDQLWFSRDRAYAFVGTRTDAEAWPRAGQPIRCA